MLFQTPPLAIKDLPADDQHLTPGTLTPRLIILHSTAGTDSRAWLTTSPQSVVSVHRLINRWGTMYKIADDTTICNHVGYSTLWGLKNLNPYALGIEFENLNDGVQPYPTAQVTAGAWQCAEWIGRWGYLPIFGHYQVDTQGKTDPKAFPWETFYRALNARLAAALA